MIGPLVAWYLIVQIVTLAAFPWALVVGRALPDRGVTLAKMLGILLVGVTLWLGYSYGLLRNERGGAWLALVVAAILCWSTGYRAVADWWSGMAARGAWRPLIVGETLFAGAFVVWAMVRAYDPAANHTEQPMDLMFMNSLWASPVYPPQDAWFAGYAISYYYLGYWLLVTLGRLADVPPNLAYNVGQACWYGLLWMGAYGVTTNLIAAQQSARHDNVGHDGATHTAPREGAVSGVSVAGGVLGGLCVAATGNLLVILEWLYAQGATIDGLARWIGVNGFPERAAQTGQWFIGYDWWWWRSSRVLQDLDLTGNHIEVIDEFPIFSYLLGDNHPHVLAMPVALLVIGLALNLYLALSSRYGERAELPGPVLTAGWRSWPGGTIALLVTVVSVGSLVFLNTWDFPPYWALLAVVAGVIGVSRQDQWFAWRWAAVVGLALVVGTVVVYLPYLVTAQSQAGGVIPNLFNPTRLSQFLVMFGGFVPALAALLVMAWRRSQPEIRFVAVWSGAVLGGAALLLVVAGLAANITTGGQAMLARMALPDGMTYGGAMVGRWLSQPWTFLLTGSAVAITGASLVTLLRSRGRERGVLPFVLFLAGLGFALVFTPEVLFLRDNFGTRMNTIFKFYYQAWLLFGLTTAYVIGVVWSRREEFGTAAVRVLATLSFVLVLGGLMFPVAGVYTKTGGFSATQPTLDATEFIRRDAPDVAAAAAWIRDHTAPGTLVLEAKGASYRADTSRISTMTGRPTLLGWDGHQAQWRGEAYGAMALGRPEAIDTIYRSGAADEVVATLRRWGIDYVVIGPTEMAQYGITEVRLGQLREVLEPVFVSGQVVILRPGGGR